MKQLGATEVLESCEADEQGDERYAHCFFSQVPVNPFYSTEGAFLSWCQLLRLTLAARFPLPNGKEPLSEDRALPSRRTLALLDTGSDAISTNGHEHFSSVRFPSSSPDIDQRPVKGAVAAVLQSNVRVTPKDHWQDVRLLTLSLKTSVAYLPGDALAILPKNFHQDVNLLIELMDWTSVADKPVCLAQTSPSGSTAANIHSDIPVTTTTLRTLLSDYLDITAIPRRSFFSKIARYTSDDMHKERLLEFTEAQYLDEYYDYATRPRRSVLEVLQEFDSVRIPWEEAISVFPITRPRQFSIASGGTLKRNSDGTARFDLLVAVVKYRTVIKKIRQGVCTRYLAALFAGSTLNVTLRTEGRFHSRAEEFLGTHVLIGAGTGIAPLRALVYEKELIGQKVAWPGSTALILGSRSRSADYFFEDEWNRFMSQDRGNPLQLATAFSRDQKAKVYVQNRIREQAEQLFQQIHDERAVVIVCGSSGQMPKAVRQALVEVIEQGLKTRDGSIDDSKKEAEEYLSNMERIGRFKQETW